MSRHVHGTSLKFDIAARIDYSTIVMLCTVLLRVISSYPHYYWHQRANVNYRFCFVGKQSEKDPTKRGNLSHAMCSRLRLR